MTWNKNMDDAPRDGTSCSWCNDDNSPCACNDGKPRKTKPKPQPPEVEG